MCATLFAFGIGVAGEMPGQIGVTARNRSSTGNGKEGLCGNADADCNDTCGLEICGVLSGVCEVNPTRREYFTLLQPLFA